MHRIKFTRIKQHFPENSLPDVNVAVEKALEGLNGVIVPGGSIAIGVGSRGIDNLQVVVKETVRWIREKKANPFIVPAMGSHGGATPEGQTAILNDYGITEREVGAPVRATMEVVSLKSWKGPNELFMDRYAYESDGIIMINKVKPHTDFRGTYESGLVKMSVIGLGKEKGALAMHKFGVYGLSRLMEGSGRHIFSTGKILGGIALVENAYDETMLIKGLPAVEVFKVEPALLELAKNNRPAFPLNKFDVLILDRMGKNISGAGIDTNIIGRIKIHGQDEPSSPSIRAITVSDLTDESHGNATGVGLADVMTRKLYKKIDFRTTYTNIVTSSFLERGKLPVIAETDAKALAYALRSCGYLEPGSEKIIRVRDTLHMDEMYVSEAVLHEIGSSPAIEVIRPARDIFDEKGMMDDF